MLVGGCVLIAVKRCVHYLPCRAWCVVTVHISAVCTVNMQQDQNNMYCIGVLMSSLCIHLLTFVSLVSKNKINNSRKKD